MNDYVPVAPASQVPSDRGLTVRVDGREFALFRVDEAIYALGAECPHRGGPLGEGRTQDGHVHCPLHGWEFDLKTGACREHPERPATCVATRVVDGQVEIRIG
jgi:nitrite reductase/ring-hydroxylating ferredoxin subunit